jgi:hypothetical protein
MTISRRPLLALLPLVISVSGCVAWRQQPAPEPSSSRRLPDPLRVTRNDQSVVVMEDAVVSGDSLVGYAGRDHARTSVALAEVRTMQGRKTDVMATVGLAAAAALAAALFAISYSLGSRLGT